MLIRNEAACWACLEGFRDRRRDAERRRLTAQKPMGQRKRHRLRKVLVWLGQRLVIWGTRLEEGNCPACQPLRSGL
jgi:hypothetical protein